MGNEQQKKKKKPGSTRRVMKYFAHITKNDKGLFFLANIGGIGAMVISLLLPIYYAKIIDTIMASGSGDKIGTVHILLGILLIIALLEVGSIISRRVFGFSLTVFEVRGMKRIFNECFAYLHRHSYRFFTNNFSGSLVKKVNKLAYSFEGFMDMFVYEIVRMVIALPFIVIAISMQNKILGLVFLGFIIVFMGVQYCLYKWNIPYEIKSNEQDSKTTGELADTITNNFNILTFASLKQEIKRFGDTVENWKILAQKKGIRSERMYGITSVLMVIFEVVSIYVCINLRGKGLITTGVIILTQSYIFKIFEQLSSLRHIMRGTNKTIGESIEMIEILDEAHEIQDHTDKNLEVHSGKIEFNTVRFNYIDGRNIFNNLTLRIKPGEKVAIVGQSGGGKTTLVKLLFRFFDIQGGNILVDGQDIAQVTQDSLRGSISMVPQDTVLFHRSIKENIAYGNPDASDEEIIAAAKMARCHEFILKLKNGYDTTVGERGIKLSGGERQRVAIARAILENKRILVLDEATSSLDSESEHLIQEAMDEVMKNKTTIVIAHRLSTIMKMDKIVVMDKGQIIEKGSHKELLATPDSTYKRLRDIQSGGFMAEAE